MESSPNKDRLMWLLVILCTAGVFLMWLPYFLSTVWDFSDAVGKKGQVSQSAFLDNLKEVQVVFEKNLDEQKKVTTEISSAQAIKPLDESQLNVIAQKLTSFSENAGEKTSEPISSLTPKAYCTRRAGIYEDRAGINDSLYGVCRFTDGSECHALLFLREKCHVGQYKSAEDGIPKWPDLEITFSSMDYCLRVNGVLKTVPKEQARGICIAGVVAHNSGIAKSKAAKLIIDEKSIAVPALQPQKSFSFPSPIILQKTLDLSTITLELQTSFQEIDKENNVTHYAAKTN